MPARPGNWSLVGESSDPIVADVAVLEDLIGYYRSMADAITSEAEALTRIGDGDESQFKGKAADKVRGKSKDVAKALHQMSGRYEAVRDALQAYLPELQRGLDESAAALRDAEDASAAGSRADGMPDPGANRPNDAPPLTDDEQRQISDRQRAQSDASSASDAATARLRRAVDAVNGAGDRASSTIRAAWDDGLHDTLGDKIKAFFAKLLKILVKILTYIGLALAAFAILIPGVGLVAFMAAVVGAVTLVANIALAAMGEGSWLDVITSALSVVLVGVGAALTKIVSISKTAALAGSKTNYIAKMGKNIEVAKIERGKAFDNLMKEGAPLSKIKTDLGKFNTDIAKFEKNISDAGKNVVAGFKEKPNWWHPLDKKLWADDKNKVFDVLKKGDWRWDRLLSVDRYREMNQMQNELKGIANIGVPPAWHAWAQGGRVITSTFGNTIIYGQGLKPTGFGSDQERLPGYNDFAGSLKTPAP